MKNNSLFWFCLLIIWGSAVILIDSCKKEPEIEYGTVSDIDGNSYKTVKIGSQEWMAENLKTTKYKDGTLIPYVTDKTVWKNSTTPAYCWYDNDIANKDIYGALYKWYTVNTGKLCPAGWHVPTDDEFNTLELSLGMPSAVVNEWGWRGTDQGEQMKNDAGWASDGNGTNKSGFSALPAGYRNYTAGDYFGIGVITYWWSSSDEGLNAWYRRLDGANKDIYKANTTKTSGKSIRCVKD